jgi:hypothetical protein
MQNGQNPSQLLFTPLTKFGSILWKFFITKTFSFYFFTNWAHQKYNTFRHKSKGRLLNTFPNLWTCELENDGRAKHSILFCQCISDGEKVLYLRHCVFLFVSMNLVTRTYASTCTIKRFAIVWSSKSIYLYILPLSPLPDICKQGWGHQLRERL